MKNISSETAGLAWMHFCCALNAEQLFRLATEGLARIGAEEGLFLEHSEGPALPRYAYDPGAPLLLVDARATDGFELFAAPLGGDKLVLGLRALSADADVMKTLNDLGVSPQEQPSDACAEWPALKELHDAGIGHPPEHFSLALSRRLQSAEDALTYYQAACADHEDRIRLLEYQLRQQQAAKPLSIAEPTLLDSDAKPFPEDFTALPEWLSQYSSTLVVLPRALNAAKKSCYIEPQRVYGALQYLATTYHEWRLSRVSRADNEKALAECGVALAGSTTPTVAGQQGEQYFVNWEGERLFLDWHLVRGGGNNTRYCMRVYFTWHARTSKVIVGWMPSHLRNSLT